MGVSGTSLLTSLLINGGVCLVAVAIFSLLRKSTVGKRFYAPKRYDPEVKRKPPHLPSTFLGWIKPVLMLPEDEIIAVAGLDVLIFIQLLYYGFLIFAFCTFWCCALLMPINGTAGFLASGAGGSDWTDLDLLSVSNVPPRSPRFWAHLITAYLITGVALYLLTLFSKDVSRTRAAYLASLPRGATTHTVLVTDIPGLGTGLGAKLAAVGTIADPEKGGALTKDPAAEPWADAAAQLKQKSPEEFVEEEMKAVYGRENVAAVALAYDTRKVDPLMAKYEAQKSQLQDVTEDYVLKVRKGTTIEKRRQVSLWNCFAPAWAKAKYQPGCCKTVPVDALEYMPENLTHLHDDVVKERDAVKGAPIPAAFVTFTNRYTQTLASTGLHAYDETTWRVVPAPGPEEILWGNLGMAYFTRTIRSTAMWGVFVTILIFYLPVTAAIQALVNIQNLLTIGGPALAAIFNGLPFVKQVVEGILPGLVLKIFLILLPPVLAAMARFEGKVSLSAVDFSIVSRFFIFQVFATFIYQFLVGSALNAVDSFKNNPGYIVEVLGISAAKQGSFFMTYIMINACGIGLNLLNIVGFLIYNILNKIAGTERAKYRLWSKQLFSFGTNTANHTIILLLGLSYCCLSPLIAPFCLLYYVLALVSQQYKLVYVNSREYEATGRMWYTIFQQIMVAIYFLQAMLACVLGVKKFGFVALIVPLPIVTAWYHIQMNKLFARPWTLMNLREAAALDAQEGQALSAQEKAEVSQMYVNPAFKLDETEHRQRLDDAAQVDARLKDPSAPLTVEVEDMVVAEDA